MRLLPINNLQNRQIQFNGLWGKSVSEFNIYESCAVIERITEYHPFKDESKESISCVISQYPDMNNTRQNETIKCYEYVHVRRRLPFTQNEYVNYKNMDTQNGDKLSALENKVLRGLKKYGLENYIKSPHKNYIPETAVGSFKRFVLKLFK